MVTAMIIIFIIGYILIASGEVIGINKGATALVLGIILWCLYIFSGASAISGVSPAAFEEYITSTPGITHLSPTAQATNYVANLKVVEQLGNVSEILFYLLAAMAIVELIDIHGGFTGITRLIKTRSKKKLLWLMAFITFFMSSVLDNMTSAIVMVTLLQKIVADKQERWLFGSVIVIAANAGGVWTPIGDITTIMLWMNENITSGAIMKSLFLPAIISVAVPIWMISNLFSGQITPISGTPHTDTPSGTTSWEQTTFLILGVISLLFVPVFKSVTNLPPVMGILLSLGILWIYTEVVYNRKRHLPLSRQHRMPQVLSKIDLATILFFFGILMAVGALEASGILGKLTIVLNSKIDNIYLLSGIIGILSSVIDNVPLVAGIIGMYPIAPETAILHDAYMENFIQNGSFWELIAYCTGIGGSILIIGSAAGVVVMGLAKISFTWYLKKISWVTVIGMISGIGVYYFLHL